MNWQVITGDCRDVLRSLPAQSVHTVITSPPYFGLRDYGTGEWEGGDPACAHKGAPRQSTSSTLAGNGHGPDRLSSSLQAQTVPVRDCPCGARRVDRQIGLEPTPDEFVAALVAVFREVRRVLRDDGTVWLNLGDSYATTVSGNAQRSFDGHGGDWGRGSFDSSSRDNGRRNRVPEGWKPKDLLGIPWTAAFALRADGWFLRSDIIWSKPNPMPESVTDRPTKAHEYLFLLSKSTKYAYDADAIREWDTTAHSDPGPRRQNGGGSIESLRGDWRGEPMAPIAGRNKRSVWTVATQPYAGAHFATFPPKLIEPCVLAGAPERACGVCGAPWVRVVERSESAPQRQNYAAAEAGAVERHRGLPERAGGFYNDAPRTIGFEPSCSHADGSAAGVVLDPFAGAGTTGIVALQHGRDFIGIELNPEYADMARDRIGTAVRLGFRPPQRGPEVDEGQASLFELNGSA